MSHAPQDLEGLKLYYSRNQCHESKQAWNAARLNSAPKPTKGNAYISEQTLKARRFLEPIPNMGRGVSDPVLAMVWLEVPFGEKFLKHPSNTYEIPMQHPSSTHTEPIKHPSNICLSKFNPIKLRLTPIKHSSNICQTTMDPPSNTSQTTIKPSSNTYHTPAKHP
jgi:hypothetical protein